MIFENAIKLKRDLHLIEIELFSYCNRTCWFCPNSFIDRRSSNIEMPHTVYSNIIDQLANIEYDGYITFSRYNEPTSQRELFIERIREARAKLPNVKLKTNSNGDYLTKDYIVELHDAGLNELYIQQYDANKDKWDHERIHCLMLKKLNNFGLPFNKIIDIPGGKIEYEIIHKDMIIHLRARNFIIDGSSRGDVIQLGGSYTRTQKCVQPFNNMYIDYNGSIMICCALRSDITTHGDGIMGNVNSGSLADIFYNEAYDPWRKHLLVDGPKSGVCKSCKDGVKQTYEQ